ncbi:hypothetical protein KC19_VG246800, partial [Ceratodon purpureus]
MQVGMAYQDNGFAGRHSTYFNCLGQNPRNASYPHRGCSWYHSKDCFPLIESACVDGAVQFPNLLGTMATNSDGSSSNAGQATSNGHMPVISTYLQRPPYMHSWGQQMMYGGNVSSVMEQAAQM